MIIELLKQKRKKIILASVVSALSGVTNIWVLKLINQYAINIDDMNKAVLVFFISLAIMVVIGLASQIYIAKMSAGFFYEIRKTLVQAISKLTHQRQEIIGNHRLYSTLTSDVNVINGFLSSLPGYVYNLTVVLCCLIYMAFMSFELFLVFVSFAFVGVSVSQFYILRKGSIKFSAARESQDLLYQSYESIIDGSKELTLHKRREIDFHSNDFEPSSADYMEKSFIANIYWSLSSAWFSSILFIAVGVIVFLAQGVFNFSTEALLQFILVVLYVLGPISMLVDSLSRIASVRVVINRLAKLEVDIQVDAYQQHDKQQKLIVEQHQPFEILRLDNICFTYETEEQDDSFSIGPISCEFKRGDIVFLVGGNGSGKTTVSKIIAGLYIQASGEIYLNGKKKTSLNSDEYYTYFSSIFSDYYLFNKVLRKDGVTVTDKQLNDYIKKLQLSEKVTIKDGVISTTKLSQGQRKRLALLVACFDDSEIYIFDEWAAEQDPEFREFFYLELLPELRKTGKTIIVVTHDDRYYHLADHLIRFESGQIISNESFPVHAQAKLQ